MAASSFAALALVACASAPAPREESGTQGATTGDVAPAGRVISLSLPGHDETLLVGGEDARGNPLYRILHIGERSSVRDLDNPPDGYGVAGHSDGDRFLVITKNYERDDAALSTIDPAAASVVASVSLAVPSPHAFAPSGSGTIFVTSEEDGSLHEVETATGREVRAAVVEPSSGTERVSLNTVRAVGDRLVVYIRRKSGGIEARGAVAFLDPTTLAVTDKVELVDPTPEDPTKVFEGKNPDGEMVVDAARSKLFVTAKGSRDVGGTTGGILRIDLGTKAIDRAQRSGAWQGPVVLGSNDDAWRTTHTSTPTFSTHVDHYALDADGWFTSSAAQASSPWETLDAFTEVRDFPTNRAHTLFALPISCVAGFCVGGKRVQLVDIPTQTKLASPTGEDLGLAPSFVVFQ